MGCYIKKYEELRKALGFSDSFAIVKKGFSAFYTQPDAGDCEEIIDSLGLEIALACHVDEFNKIYADIETPWSMNVINHMNQLTWKRSPIELPKTYDLLQKKLLPHGFKVYRIINSEDADRFGLNKSCCRTKLMVELDLVAVFKVDFDAKFNQKIEWGKVQLYIDGKPIETISDVFHYTDDIQVKENPLWVQTLSFTIDATGINKALEDMAEDARKSCEKIELNINRIGSLAAQYCKSPYTCTGSISVPSGKTFTGAWEDRETSDIIDVSDMENLVNEEFKKSDLFKKLNDLRTSWLGKPDTDLNRVAMQYGIGDIFKTISDSISNYPDLIVRECESSPSVVVNIGSVNIDSKEETFEEWQKKLPESFMKIMQSLKTEYRK